MSEPKLISPMLDDFLMGEPMSSHHGVRCCPAIIKDTDSRYIVKIISIPASQNQTEALLLTGACKDQEAVDAYYQELALEIEKETEILRKLADLEGFTAYEKCQIVPMEGETGYDVYLLGTYKQSLERFFRKNTMTHLAAVNMGIDLCAALTMCRRAGFLYVDLKPGNVYMVGDKEYKIGDIGFVRLNALSYATLPDRYTSPYVAPEARDAYAGLNTTMDIYALGMILYQAFNGGALPTEGEEIASPLYADYEMAEIILKACAADPADRWQNPADMGQALVSYMQRNEVNDVPLVPPTLVTDDISIGELAQLDEEDVSSDALTSEEEEYLQELTADETAPDTETAPAATYEELTVDVSDILAQADELLLHETPQGVIQPEPIKVPVPAPIIEEEPEPPIEDIIGQTVEDIQMPDHALEETPEYEDEEEEYDEYPYEPKSRKGVVAFIIVIFLLAGILFGGYTYYKNFYLQPVEKFEINGSQNSLSIEVSSQADEALLTAVCTDVYGNKQTSAIVGGKATFENLNPNTLYTVKLEINGFYKLTGVTSKSYSTPPQTNIVTFSAVAGSEDGSVILSFTVDGQDNGSWVVRYSAADEEEKTVSFNNHMVILNGLTVGKEYTFTLASEEGLYLTGNHTITYTTSSLIFAENLAITGCSGNTLSVLWNAPEGAQVESWEVRCYNSDGYDQTMTVEDTSAVFVDVDTTKAYTVEVVAKGMTSGSRCYVSANSVTIRDASAVANERDSLHITWDFEGPAPVGGWLLLYTIDGSDRQEVIKTETNSVTLSPVVPEAKYTFTVALEDGSTVFGTEFSGITQEAKKFSGYTVTADNMALILVNTDDLTKMTEKDWRELYKSEYKTAAFKATDGISVPIRMDKTYDTSNDIITSLFIIRDEEGNLVSNYSNQRSWTNMWYRNNCTLTVPTVPSQPGKYTMEIYFNGMFVQTMEFEIVE